MCFPQLDNSSFKVTNTSLRESLPAKQSLQKLLLLFINTIWESFLSSGKASPWNADNSHDQTCKHWLPSISGKGVDMVSVF